MICLPCAAGADLYAAAIKLDLDERDVSVVNSAVTSLHGQCEIGCNCQHRFPQLNAFKNRCIAHGKIVPHYGCEESVLMWMNTLVKLNAFKPTGIRNESGILVKSSAV